MLILLIVNQVKKKPKQAPKPDIPMHHEKKGKRHKGELNLYLQYFHCFSASHNYISVIE